MRAAFFNPNRAIEYLLNGIPENVQAQQRQAAPAPAAGGDAPTQAQPTTQAPTSDQPATVPDDDGINLFEAAAQAGQQGTGLRSGQGQTRSAPTATAGQGGQLDLSVLRNNAQFQQLRQLVQQQPAMLEPILQQLAEGNPQLAQMISQNPDQFLQLLSEVRISYHFQLPFTSIHYAWPQLLPPNLTSLTIIPGRRRRQYRRDG